MLKIFALIAIVLLNISVLSAQQPVGTGALILSRGASPIIMGVGGAGVAFPVSDATSFSNNPAHLGSLMREDNLLFTYSTNTMNPSEIPFKNIALNIGYNLDEHINFPLTIGMALMFQDADYGEFTKTDDNGNIIGKYFATESSRSFAISASAEYYAHFSLGLTYKIFNSELEPLNFNQSYESGTGHAIDFGASVSLPILKKAKLLDHIFVDIGANLAWAMLNVGSEIDYLYYSEPFPKTSSTGYSMSVGLNYEKDDFELELMKINWSAAAMESLTYYDSTGFAYDYPFNEISFVDNLIFMNANSYVRTGFGWNISLLETFTILKGWSYTSNTMLPSDGVVISSRGITKYLKSQHNSKIWNVIDKNLSISYCLTKITIPFSENNDKWVYDTFQSINIALRL
ncbi:MAG: hypothetical protein CVV22_05495 [Ignavibacteriae bacterium HGW-Ignavibacteriae-1]|jgi:hypothetical protein|nr:MAG: hypothetical protein CVV22_05495 [Ignavibacteriae bacterium HGW-Ignavibacteriae-1]